MHPPRRNGIIERPTLIDRLTDWLLTHCPVSTLTLLTTLVVSTEFGIARPWPALAAAATADVVIALTRRRRRTKRASHSGHAQSNVPA